MEREYADVIAPGPCKLDGNIVSSASAHLVDFKALVKKGAKRVRISKRQICVTTMRSLVPLITLKRTS